MPRKYKTTDTIHEDNPFVLSIGDLMAALLLIFVLLLSATLLQLQREFEIKAVKTEEARRDAERKEVLAERAKISAQKAEESAKKIQDIAKTYKKLKEDLYDDLFMEFKDDLIIWKAIIDKETLSIRFKEPDVYFDPGKSFLRKKFKDILDSFFLRYIKLLFQPKYKENIEEIRIEGHTSSEWQSRESPEYAYFKNMELSQERTRSVLEYVLGLISAAEIKDWARDKITANGLSFSKRLFVNGMEDREASRRVEFRVRTDAEEQIRKILGSNKEQWN